MQMNESKLAINLIDLQSKLREFSRESSKEISGVVSGVDSKESSGEISKYQTVLSSLIGPDILARWETSTEPENGSQIRILLTTNRNTAAFTRRLEYECSGVIILYPSWDIISVPSPMLRPAPNLRDLDILKFTVYGVSDGTTTAMYYYDGKWRLSTKNGFDIGPCRWIGPKTYDEVFEELFQLYDFNIEKLDKSTCYTIGFHYGDFHPILTDPNRMWLIQTSVGPVTTVFTLPESPISDIGLPYQISLINLGGTSTEVINTIISKNTNSMSRYFAVNKKDSVREIHYGFILRSNQGMDSNLSTDFIVESELLKNIRMLMYNLPKRRQESATVINADNRREYMILKSYLSYNTRYIFTNLFPQCKERMEKYNEMFKQLNSKIIMILSDDKITAATPLDRLAFQLTKYINLTCKINPLDPNSPSIIDDFINNTNYLELYYTWLSDNK